MSRVRVPSLTLNATELVWGDLGELRGFQGRSRIGNDVEGLPPRDLELAVRPGRVRDDQIEELAAGDGTVKKIAAASRRPDGKLDRNAILTRERIAVFELIYPELRMAALLSKPLFEAIRQVEAAIARDGPGGPK